MQADGANDAELVDASRRGDRDAFGRIIERYQRAVYAVSFSGVRDRSLSDDITQDTFVTAWHRLGELRDTARLPAWLCGIARNHARDARKRRRREDADVTIDLATAATPFDALSDAETDRLIAAALDDVPDAYREPLVLFYYEQRSVEEVARALGITIDATHQRLSRGRRCLAARMTAVVDGGLARRGPKPELVACVLAAIGAPASHVDASPAAKGSTMHTKLTFITIVALSVGAAGVMSAETIRDRSPSAPATSTKASKPTASAKAKAPAPARSTNAAAKSKTASTTSTAAPQLAPSPSPRAPDCTGAGTHMADLLETPKLAKFFVDKCASQKWSENVRICIVDAQEYERAKIDCTDETAATAAEVAAMPAHLKCDVLSQHVYKLANGPDGKFTMMKRKLAKSPQQVAQIDRMATVLREDLANECDQRPWSVEKRTCVVASKTHEAYGACGKDVVP